MVYKAVLTDDEALIAEGPCQAADWTGHNCQAAATACDAVSGARAIRQCQPDILFTDIKMPRRLSGMPSRSRERTSPSTASWCGRS